MSDVFRDFSDDGRTDELAQTIARLHGAACLDCRRVLCGHEIVMAVVIGQKNAPRCRRCAAQGLREPENVWLERLTEHVHRRDCFRSEWVKAGEAEGSDDRRHPSCLWQGLSRPEGTAEAQSGAPSAPAEDALFDAGDMGCGDLVLELRRRLMPLPPGTVLKVTARDPGAPEDLPAWCGLTGHILAHARHPEYWIRRRQN